MIFMFHSFKQYFPASRLTGLSRFQREKRIDSQNFLDKDRESEPVTGFTKYRVSQNKAITSHPLPKSERFDSD